MSIGLVKSLKITKWLQYYLLHRSASTLFTKLSLLSYTRLDLYHRCTVVETPGSCFWGKLFWGVTWDCDKIWVETIFVFYWIFMIFDFRHFPVCTHIICTLFFSDSTLGGFPSCLRRAEHLWNFSFEGRRHENCRLFGIQVKKKVCFLTFGNMRKCINHYDNSIPKKLFFFWLMFRREQSLLFDIQVGKNQDKERIIIKKCHGIKNTMLGTKYSWPQKN